MLAMKRQLWLRAAAAAANVFVVVFAGNWHIFCLVARGERGGDEVCLKWPLALSGKLSLKLSHWRADVDVCV